MSTSLEGWERTATTHHVHLAALKLSARVSPVALGMASNRADSIRYRIIDKGVRSIGENAAGDIAAPTCVDQAANGSGRYIAKRNWQDRVFCTQALVVGVKLPDVSDRVASRNVKSAKDV